MTLHIFQSIDSLQRAGACLQSEDEIVLVGDGTYLALPDTPLRLKAYVLTDDASLRGLTATNHFTPIDMAGFVALTAKHPHTLSW
ncbi:hypothetical protein NCG89_00655 [Spongiibacter taiwanensis]|uniref:DsrH/TusB family sulfur relay protein n=1 Tax=Spongiibacter taiwanensis TaxID=1748242 RepID=UPI0020353BF1|nr:DsrH/TusB family sulfur metabolism protein [Spongiibacter taiwanensis]USA43312.1 hypothetical protein NCG89_00655 [Spongiibacter taiwanensis]